MGSIFGLLNTFISDLRKGTINGTTFEPYALPLNDRTNNIFVRCESPRVRRYVLKGERNFALFLVDVKNNDLYSIAFGKDFSGIGDSAPAHLGDVDKSVYSAEVNKRSEIRKS